LQFTRKSDSFLKNKGLAKMTFEELSLDQRRRLIDAKQAFEAWREADREFRHSYRGSMRWKRIDGQQHLYRIYGNVAKYIGPQSPATERIKGDYTEQRTKLRRRVTTLENRLASMERLNRAANLGRVPEIAARILRKLDQEGLLGTHLFVVGTHSLYAYESAAGVTFDTGLTATGDVDLLWDVRRRLSLALVDFKTQGVIGLLRRIDRSFAAQPRTGFRAVNGDGYYVDLIRPIEPDEIRFSAGKLGLPEDDLEAAAIVGLQWLINAPKFEQIVMGADGRPVWMCCIDPRAFALHKYWVSKEPTREAIKKRRDVEQAKAVAQVATQYLGLEFKAKDLSALPMQLVQCAKELLETTGRKHR
jgi:hypothetical protein